MKNLTLKRILKRHAGLHRVIENGKLDKDVFDEIVKRGTKQEAFDKKK
ncbi:MAG TPA: hypothetical protein VNW29_05530 [Candidatus Sulfotelmatobacter sp.]|jgi:hypothetical protein|nr:hypothetical protein [Candidatus Sulfotelmatobacter sp.]